LKGTDQVPEHSAAILLAHEPDFADISAATGRFGLQISGHTHGGQIQIPLASHFLLPPRGRKYPSGQYKLNGMMLYTNRGIGTSWLKFRYRCPPEISVYILQAN
jgi:predicted MPP superfamily phosphohydrolase